MKKIESMLLNNLVINDNQGYALYFESTQNIIEKYNGFEKANNENKININTNFRLASVSKQFIAYGILLLIKDKKLKLKTNLSTIFDNLPDYMKQITIEQLLTHTSGLYDYEDKDHDDTQIYDSEVLDYLKTLNKTYFIPGTKYQYSNTGYIVLGQIIEKIENKSISDFIKEKIFTPIKMSDSFINVDGLSQIKNRAHGNIIVDDKLIEKDQGWTTATVADGGIYSSIKDLKKWINYISKQQWLQNSMFKTNILKNGTNIEYGYGIRIVKYKNYKIIYHCGDTIGTSTIIGFIPKKKIKFIFLTNLNEIDTNLLVKNLIKILNDNLI